VHTRTRLHHLWPQPLVGGGTAVLAVFALAAAWISPTRGGGGEGVATLALTLCMSVAIVAAYHFPLHLRGHGKVHMASAPYYLLAALVSPPLAATAAALATLVGEVSVRAERGLYAGDIASQVGRRTVVVLLGALVAHAPGSGAAPALALVGAAVVLGAGDIVTCPLVLSPMGGASPRRVVALVARETSLTEGAQYVLGLLGVLAAEHHLWAPLLLLPPTALLYRALKRAQELQARTEQLLHRAQVAHAQAHAAQGQAEEAQRVAEDAVRVRDNFLITAAHDLRTPLTNIMGRAEIVGMRLDNAGPPADAWLRAQTHSLHTSARRMAATVEEITDAAHLQMGQFLPLRREPVDVGEMVRVLLGTSPWIDAPPVALDAPAGVVVAGDRARLERVVQNIVENAFKYNRAATPVQVELRRQERWAALTVRDDGVGIPADELPHLFTPFYRASTATGAHGTGIGLAGAKAIVAQHSGTITVESVVGRGTTVRVLLPLDVEIPGRLADGAHTPPARAVAVSRQGGGR